MNLSIFILHNVVSSFAQRFYYWPRLTQSWYILLCFFSKKKGMFEKYVYLTLIKDGEEKENHSQQIPTFRCSEWSNFKDLFCKWNESGFRPPLCTYRLNWARRTSWGWWDDTVLQTQDTKFKPWRSEAEHATSRSRRLPTTDFHTWMGKKHFCFFQSAETGNRTPNSGVKGSGANHYPRAPALLCKDLLLWPHRGYVAIIDLTSS